MTEASSFKNLIDGVFSDRDERNMKVQDAMLEIEAELEKHKFKMRPHVAQFLFLRNQVCITRPDNSRLFIEESDIQKALDGELGITKDDLEELNNWYSISFYKKGVEMNKFDKRLIEIEDDDIDGLFKLDEEVQATGYLDLDDNEKRKNMILEYEYNEHDPERLKLLKEILYRYNTKEDN